MEIRKHILKRIVPALLTGLAAFAPARIAAPQHSDATGNAGVRVECALLTYADGKTAQCFSDRFLTRISSETRIQAAPQFRKIRLDSPDLCRYPFAVLTGEGRFTFTPKERVQLRYYLTHGGFLLASPGCSNAQWSASFRHEIAALFPGQPLAPLRLTHPLFRMVYLIDSLGTKHGLPGKTATLEALQTHDRIRLLLASDGLNDSEHATNCCCCGGDEIDRAEFINVNALAYALVH